MLTGSENFQWFLQLEAEEEGDEEFEGSGDEEEEDPGFPPKFIVWKLFPALSYVSYRLSAWPSLIRSFNGTFYASQLPYKQSFTLPNFLDVPAAFQCSREFEADENPDELLLGFLHELSEKGSEYSFLDVYSVYCRRGKEAAIIKCIREDIANETSNIHLSSERVHCTDDMYTLGAGRTSSAIFGTTFRSLFGQSGHPWLLSPEQIATMPPSSDWVFSAGELVTVVNPVSTEAIVDVARDGGTEVARTVVLVPNTYLRKKISVGNTVEIVARGKTLRRAVTTGLKNNNISTVKWDHIPVVGLRGSVTELDDDANVACVVFGCFEAVLQIHVKSIQSIASGSSTREQWVDYDFIRRANFYMTVVQLPRFRLNDSQQLPPLSPSTNSKMDTSLLTMRKNSRSSDCQFVRSSRFQLSILVHVRNDVKLVIVIMTAAMNRQTRSNGPPDPGPTLSQVEKNRRKRKVNVQAKDSATKAKTQKHANAETMQKSPQKRPNEGKKKLVRVKMKTRISASDKGSIFETNGSDNNSYSPSPPRPIRSSMRLPELSDDESASRTPKRIERKASKVASHQVESVSARNPIKPVPAKSVATAKSSNSRNPIQPAKNVVAPTKPSKLTPTAPKHSEGVLLRHAMDPGSTAPIAPTEPSKSVPSAPQSPSSPPSPSPASVAEQETELLETHRDDDQDLCTRAAQVDQDGAIGIWNNLHKNLSVIAAASLAVPYEDSNRMRRLARSYVWKNEPSTHARLCAVAHSDWSEILVQNLLDENEDMDLWSAAAMDNEEIASRIYAEAEDMYYNAARGIAGQDLPRTEFDYRALLRSHDSYTYESIRNSAHIQWQELIESNSAPNYPECLSPAPSPAPISPIPSSAASNGFTPPSPSPPSPPIFPPARIPPFTEGLVDYSSDADTQETGDSHEGDEAGPTGEVDAASYAKFTVDFMDDDGVEEEEANSEEDVGAGEANDDEDDEDEDAEGKPGRLSKKFRARLDEVHDQYRASVLEAAKEERKDIQACWRYLEEGLRAPRSLNWWNAFKAWWAVHGDVQQESRQSLTDWNQFLREKYMEVLQSRLSENDINDPEARSRAMKPEVDWYRDQMDSYFTSAKDSGQMRNTVKQIMRPLGALARKINDTTGYHIFSFLISTATDRSGCSLSAFLAGDDQAKIAKETFQSKIIDQIRDLESYVRLVELDSRHVTAELSALMSQTKRNIVNGRREDKKDWEKRLLHLIFEYDIKICLGDDLPTDCKVNLNNFLNKAWIYKIRVSNWAAGRFPKYHVHNIADMTTQEVRELVTPQKDELEREYNIQTWRLNEETAPPVQGVPFVLERWPDDDQELNIEDQGEVPLVIDTNNEVLVSVADVQSWQTAVGQRAPVPHKRRRNVTSPPKAKLKLSLFASDSEEESEASTLDSQQVHLPAHQHDRRILTPTSKQIPPPVPQPDCRNPPARSKQLLPPIPERDCRNPPSTSSLNREARDPKRGHRNVPLGLKPSLVPNPRQIVTPAPVPIPVPPRAPIPLRAVSTLKPVPVPSQAPNLWHDHRFPSKPVPVPPNPQNKRRTLLELTPAPSLQNQLHHQLLSSDNSGVKRKQQRSAEGEVLFIYACHMFYCYYHLVELLHPPNGLNLHQNGTSSGTDPMGGLTRPWTDPTTGLTRWIVLMTGLTRYGLAEEIPWVWIDPEGGLTREVPGVLLGQSKSG
ncbi:hypothetical protein DFJ43DRAFT_1039329 [Lentinula guzmanii]|uniref:Uncharacterized protein n=1 Tax=Lentinula guzmanii TaxID=2804957 RepID=A0AA38JH04_9AGAR|nr:hypothetical protein DFJ43DRAFT_1039329 [Lentinula guzmanii]